MASNITSAGAASGMDFESIIQASLEVQRARLEKQVTAKKETANIELSGVSKFKSALETFNKALETLNSAEGFNTRKVTTTQPTENPYFTVTTKDDTSNGSYDIGVEQLASTEKISKSFDSDTKLQAGTLTIKVLQGRYDETEQKVVYTKEDDPETGADESEEQNYKEITIDIEDGMTIAQLRRTINEKAGDYGVTASIVETSQGQKLTIDSGISGDDDPNVQLENRLLMNFTASSSATTPDDTNDFIDTAAALNYDGPNGSSAASWNVKKGVNAIITVDGEQVTSTSNNFDNKISGLEIDVHRVSTKKEDDGTESTETFQVDVDQDVDGITAKMQNFISAYNALMDTMDALGKRNTYTDGENNYDGGELSGDSQLQSLQRQIQTMMSDISYGSGDTQFDAYSIGLELDDTGRFTLDTTKFKEGIKDNFNAVVKLFSAAAEKTSDDSDSDASATASTSSQEPTGGLIVRLQSVVKEYTKANGFLDQRTQTLNELIKDYEDQEAENEDYLVQYEENLRAKYATLDTTIASYNNSLFYLQSVLG